MLRIFVFLFLIGFAGCNHSVDSEATDKADYYFNIPSFFKCLADSLSQTHVEVTKVLIVDEKRENIRMMPASWHEEFSVFMSFDLNKSSYIGKYKVDTLETADGREVHYLTDDKKLPIKKLKITFDKNGKVNSVSAYKKDKSIVLDSELSFEYISGLGYTVHGKRAVSNMSPSVFSVSAIFAN